MTGREAANAKADHVLLIMTRSTWFRPAGSLTSSRQRTKHMKALTWEEPSCTVIG